MRQDPGECLIGDAWSTKWPTTVRSPRPIGQARLWAGFYLTVHRPIGDGYLEAVLDGEGIAAWLRHRNWWLQAPAPVCVHRIVDIDSALIVSAAAWSRLPPEIESASAARGRRASQ